MWGQNFRPQNDNRIWICNRIKMCCYKHFLMQLKWTIRFTRIRFIFKVVSFVFGIHHKYQENNISQRKNRNPLMIDRRTCLEDLNEILSFLTLVWREQWMRRPHWGLITIGWYPNKPKSFWSELASKFWSIFDRFWISPTIPG